MTPAEAIVRYRDTQSTVSTSSSPSGYPVQPLSGIFNRSSQASSSQASISIPLSAVITTTATIGALPPYTGTNPSCPPPLPCPPHPSLIRSTGNAAPRAAARDQQQQQHAVSVLPPSSSMRISALMSSSSATAAVPSISMRRTQLEHRQAHT
ncbi:hypothetical protein FOMPIDRAFT_83548 [Fomitopsis schrenkii]|uniref:Uncharacterized protein n=1 Tax=Fomitopsis schrenkii TaxID=2126942 RepID=S8E9G9_FOMSC|nr:hypothetical protein FOMPIDRAFT_83548 [Fomitopsis schrenkii]